MNSNKLNDSAEKVPTSYVHQPSKVRVYVAITNSIVEQRSGGYKHWLRPVAPL